MNVHKHQQQSPSMAADIRELTLSREAFDKVGERNNYLRRESISEGKFNFILKSR